jgi:branched-chain amino acid transport system permease protein
MESLVQNVVDGLTLGSLYALYALGIAIIFSIMRLVNFAHGELIMVGAFGAFLVRDAPLPVIAGVTLIVPLVFALGMERVAFRPVRSADPATMLVTSFAVSYLLQSIAVLIFGSRAKAGDITTFASDTVQVGSASVSVLDLITIAVTFTLLVVVGAFVQRTRLGLQMRAAAEDFRMARLVGIQADRVIALAFAISGLLAGVSAFLLLAQTAQVDPRIGLTPVLFGFLATIIGGLGSLSGAVVGGFLLGLSSTLLQNLLPIEARPFRDALVFGAVFVLLIVRPQGLFVTRGATARV